MATVPVYRTWVAGEVVTAAYFNANVRDAGNFWLTVPVAEIRQTVAQSLTTAVGANITFDTEDTDNDNGHSTVTNTDRYVPKTAGRFQICGGVGFASGAGTLRSADINFNGTTFAGCSTTTTPVGGGFTHRMGTKMITRQVNGNTDFFTIQALQNSGGALLTAVAGLEQSTMSVRWVESS